MATHHGNRFFAALFLALLFLIFQSCNGDSGSSNGGTSLLEKIETVFEDEAPDAWEPAQTLLLLPQKPSPNQPFRLLATGGKNIEDAKILVTGPTGKLEKLSSKTNDELPYRRMDSFAGITAGHYKAVLMVGQKEVSSVEFDVAEPVKTASPGIVWKTTRSWDVATETLYSAWVNALFEGSNEQTSWASLHEVTENPERNFLHNYLQMNEDDKENKNKVIMEPDCADNPFFLRAYFAWKLGLPFGYHISDRGYLGKNPGTGQWVTNETSASRSHPVLAFNYFVRRMMDGVHSGTARTSLDNENSDHYPLPLNRESLRPGTVYADPYGHTFILVSWIPQKKDKPGVLLAVDAQPDKTIAIKRFWKGNFLFNTVEVVGEPGFKAFRPILFENGKLKLVDNASLSTWPGLAPYSLEQRKMPMDTFYLKMERLINPKPLEPEVALNSLIQALHEQLLVRVKSVDNGEKYMKSHPGTVISMPSNAKGVFLAGGPWEDFSTPNRDLRLLIAMDAVLNFPDRVAQFPRDFKVSKSSSPDEIKAKLQSMMQSRISELSISYTRTDGSQQELSLEEILSRRADFEMAYNPNDGVEIRWGAPENSAERATCKRHAPPYQRQTMEAVRKWFNQRLHPPT